METREAQIRRPRQQRSRERFEAILDAAERLLQDRDPHDVSIYTIAEEADMPPPSIYHFFPDGNHVFMALAERYFNMFLGGLESIEGKQFDDWQALVEFRYALSRDLFNNNVAARKILLGAAATWAIRTRDIDTNRQLARGAIVELNRFFILPKVPELVDRITETIIMNDAIWALYDHRFGHLPDDQEIFARRARLGHMRTYLPEYLTARDTVLSVEEAATIAF
ncbi:TetR/AcrR family transcriptional regulator [Sphingopyxis sp.]|uniref:TetR/AcrR family transcriptional regulator n=1 Tax=Sphingopyxis sp. TaxID=1908224 RepID=UPI00312052DB